MNKEYKIKLDLNKKLYNKKMTFNQFDENVNDFYIEVTKNNEVVKDLDKSIVTLVAIKPNGEVDAQFIEVKEGQIYADLKPSMCDLVGNYQAKAMIVLEDEIVTTDTINYSVNEDKIISKLNEDVVSDERFTLFTDALARLSTIEISEEQRMINEAERILAEENRKIEEAKRVEAELVRQHEEADRVKCDSTRESNENIRKQNESIRLANETSRIDEEAKRVEEENKRKLAEEERNANYNFMTEDEERRRSEANAHKEAEVLRVQAETNRVNEEAKRRTTEQARVSAENTRVSNENTRETNEIARKSNETQRIEAETQRKNRYNSFITDAEANANNFENYTNTAKVKEEERKANELTRKNQETQRVSNENERLANEETRKANEEIRESNETSRQYVFENKVNEVDEKISEINTTKDNFISSINTKVDNKISEIEVAKSDMTNTVSNKINEVENRFNALTSKQQQDAEIIDARDGEVSLKARLDRDIEKAKQVYVNVEGSHISTDSSSGYLKDVEILGNTVQDASNLADIRSVGDKVEGQELYEIPVLSRGKNLINPKEFGSADCYGYCTIDIKVKSSTEYRFTHMDNVTNGSIGDILQLNAKNEVISDYQGVWHGSFLTTSANTVKIRLKTHKDRINKVKMCEGKELCYEPYVEDKLTILSPVQLEKVGDVADRIICKDGVWGVEKNTGSVVLDGNETYTLDPSVNSDIVNYYFTHLSVNVGQTINGRAILTSHSKFMHNLSEQEHCYVGASSRLYLVTAKSRANSVDEFVKLVKANNIIVKYQLEEPQFIPLPHDQQVKLRTFANKTNISFGCEIEGTIKAQVPKSLGATVNTHTEQISNLNKELDRVKKLEESTVSTVETESDFTTVEATSNGYFEDVKLEGKTLVNKSITKKLLNQTKAHYLDVGIMKVSDLVADKVYTLLYDFNCDVSFNMVQCYIGCGSNLHDLTLETSNRFTPKFGRNIITFSFNATEIQSIKDKGCSYVQVRVFIDIEKKPKTSSVTNILLLEGDHTQNPPSYFEGLKSVGQSASEDGADEIVVSSVNGDGNLFDINRISKYIEPQSDNSYRINYYDLYKANIDLLDNYEDCTQYSISYYAKENVPSTSYKDVILKITYTDGTTQNTSSVRTSEYTFISLTTMQGKTVNSIKVSFGNLNGEFYMKDLMITKGTTFKPYTPHQSDKKRLLYYNGETQSWEKPILRQWDSIEKHADGKYYYHQRSGEVVLNGSEAINVQSMQQNSNINTLRFRVKLDSKTMIANCLNAINNRFSEVVVSDKQFITDEESINIVYNDVDFDQVNIRVLKSKLSTQDVQGFKQWLQANNVTVVYQLAKEKVYECTNIDLITYANETNYVVESGAIAPRTTLKVHNNISNVVSLLQKKVSLLENNITNYMITQNRLMLASRYNADTVSFKVDVATLRNSFEYDNDLYELILNNILVGKDNYNREYIENLIIFYWMDFVISDEMYITLFEIIEEQHNPKIIEEETPLI